jgi:hypothetical protein
MQHILTHRRNLAKVICTVKMFPVYYTLCQMHIPPFLPELICNYIYVLHHPNFFEDIVVKHVTEKMPRVVVARTLTAPDTEEN